MTRFSEFPHSVYNTNPNWSKANLAKRTGPWGPAARIVSLIFGGWLEKRSAHKRLLLETAADDVGLCQIAMPDREFGACG